MSGLTEFGREAIEAVLERVGRGFGQMQERKPLSYDLLESDDAYLVVFDAPGATKSDVQVRFLKNEIEVRIDRFRDFYDGFEMRFPGRGLTLSGTATLPEDASVTDVTADASAIVTRSGTLRVEIPKSERAQTVTVEDESEVEREGGEVSVKNAGDEPDTDGTDGDDKGLSADAETVLGEADEGDDEDSAAVSRDDPRS